MQPKKIRRRGLPFGVTDKPRPGWWPPVAPILYWSKRPNDNIWRSFSSGETRFKVVRSGSSWLAYEIILIEEQGTDGFNFNCIRFVGAFPTCTTAKRKCEYLSRMTNGGDKKEESTA